MRQPLRGFDFRKLFVEELGWDHHTARLEVLADGQCFRLAGVAEKRGFQAFICEPSSTGCIPDYGTRRKIERQVTKSAHEHLIIFVDGPRTTQVWQWVKRELGKPAACREHTYDKSQPGDALIQKVQSLLVSFEEEENVTLVDVTGRARAGFDIERVTKRFYERFKTEHAAFMRFLKGIPDEEMQRWYVSVMLNRLMFIYFIQKKSFLDSDTNYLRNRLRQTQERGKDRFYSGFLCPLFFEGFAKRESERSPATNQLLGKVPYLNGGLFLRHQIEELHGKNIQIADAAFEKLFAFFEQYHWHLDERPLRADNEINPDVLGYIFEKYINQKQMGAYYTKEDITGYISQNTVIPFLFDAAQKKCKIAFEGEQAIWRLLQADPDRYIYEAVKKGLGLTLPPEIAAGLKDVSKRTEWNKPAPEEYALPTEIWREVVARRQRYEEVRAKLAAGEIQSINDLITYNLDIRQFAQDVIENCEGPELLRGFYHAIEQVTVLDPACGSGAFLFAALNILEPLYEACLDRMWVFLDELERSGEKHRPEKFSNFRKILDRVAQHPSRRYFILKSIIINNLYGVDIMEEAVEICKLRLFLKLVAQIECVGNIEPLPDIDFNIRAGNSLVGYATYDEVKRAVTSELDFENVMARIEEKVEDIDNLFALFRQQQTEPGGEVTAEDKNELRRRLKDLEEELNRHLAGEYGIKLENRPAYDKWCTSHKPFHWFIEFYRMITRGGIDSIIGNPPYVEYNTVTDEYKIRSYATELCGNLYAFFLERCFSLARNSGRVGMIVQLPIVCTDRMKPLQEECIRQADALWFSNFDDRPARLFDGLEHIRASIVTARKGPGVRTAIRATKYNRWHSEARPNVFQMLSMEDVSDFLRPGAVPKLGCLKATSVMKRLWEYQPLGKYLARRSAHTVYYHNAPQYWIRAMDFVPYFWNEPQGKHLSTQVKPLDLPNRLDAAVIAAVLNSSLFYWWFIVHSDCRHLNMREIASFPCGLEQMSSRAKSELVGLSEQLMIDLRRHAQRKQCVYKTTGRVVYDEFYPRFSKSLIDEIDRVLAKHYRLTDEELDFIVNYDIKYRMGREAEGGEE